MSDYDIVIKLDPGQPVQGAKTVTAAVAGLETQGKKAQEAMDGVASAAKSLKSIDFKQAAAAGAQAWGILSQKFEMGNTLLGKAIDSTVKFAALGAQLGGPWGAALGAIGGALIEVTDDITGLNSKITKLAEESKKISEDALKNMGGRLGELAREAKKTAEELQKMNGGLFALPGALAATFDAFSKERDIVKRAREEIEKYNAAKFAASPQGNALKGFAGGVMGAEAKKPKESAPKQWFDDTELNKLTEDLVAVLEVEKLITEEAERMGLALALKPDDMDGWKDLSSQMKGMQNDFEGISKDVRQIAEVDVLKAAQNTRKWNEELIATNVTAQVVSEALTKAASSFADTLVDAANGANVSWREWGASMLVMLEKVIAQALILKAIGATTGGIGGGGTGILGAIFGGGHATGGSYTAPATGGGPDSIPVMFRMSPRETATFTPHGQAFGGGAPATGGGTTHITVAPQIHDERAIHAAMAGPGGQRVIYSVVRQALGSVRPLG